MTERMFIANANGDWWEHTADPLYAITESELRKALGPEYAGEELGNIDKLDRTIRWAGKEAFVDFNDGPPACTCESKQCDCEEEWASR